MASAHHTDSSRDSRRQIEKEKRRKTPPDNENRYPEHDLGFETVTVPEKRCALGLKIREVVGDFKKVSRKLGREDPDGSLGSHLLGVHRQPSIPIGSASNRKPSPKELGSKPPRDADFASTSQRTEPTSRKQRPTSRPPPTHSSQRKSANEVSRETMENTIQTVIDIMRLPASAATLSPIREPPSPRNPSPPFNPNQHRTEPHRQPNQPKQPKPPKKERRPDPEPNQARFQKKSPILPNAPAVTVLVTEADSIDGSEMTTLSSHRVNVSYARLSRLRKEWKISLPDSLQRKVSDSQKALKRKSSSEKTKSAKKAREEPRKSRPTKVREAPKVQISEEHHLPVQPTVVQTEKVPADSSAVATTSFTNKTFTAYIAAAEDIKKNCDEAVSTIQCLLAYMEVSYNYLMAAHLLESELLSSNMKKDSHKAAPLHQLIMNTLELCYKIRRADQEKRRESSTLERTILDRLVVICFKTEAHLNLLLYRCENAKRDMLAAEPAVKKIMSAKGKRDNDDYCRGTPTSPSLDEEPLSKGYMQVESGDWNQVKSYVSCATYLVKAHNKWEIALKKEKETNTNNFFNDIQTNFDMRELSLMSSRKDLSTYQKTVIDKLRREIFDNL